MSKLKWRALALATAVAALSLPAGGGAAVNESHCTRTFAGSGPVAFRTCIAPAVDVHSGNIHVVAAAIPGASRLTSAVKVREVAFDLDGNRILTDVEEPYRFDLDTRKFSGGDHVLTAVALLKDGRTVNVSATRLRFVGTQPSAPARAPFTPRTGRSTTPFVVAAVGDGAGGRRASSRLLGRLASLRPNLLLYLGDVYETGTSTEYDNWYGPSWGRFRSITNPVVGNHEYDGGKAAGYVGYWAGIPLYYGYEAAGWQFLALDSNHGFRALDAGKPQRTWLESEFGEDRPTCKIVQLHHPVVTHEPDMTTRARAMWRLLVERGADIVLAGHVHNYQRWVPLSAAGEPAATGVVQFVAGTGGQSVARSETPDDRRARVIGTKPGGIGVLLLTLNVRGAAYRYVDADGRLHDWGAIPCGGETDLDAPGAPTHLRATPLGKQRLRLDWREPVDDVGITGYELYRDTRLVARIPPTTRSIVARRPGDHSYEVRAIDGGGHRSAPSQPVAVLGTA